MTYAIRMHKEFLRELKCLGSGERAQRDRAYHKSMREHWGVAAAASTAFCKTYTKELQAEALLPLAKALWETDQFDSMMCAGRILALPRVRPSPALWEMLRYFFKQVDGWALEDNLAHVAWKCILADERLLDEVELWTSHSSFWIRRAALVYTLPYAKKGENPERMLGWAALYAPDPEWFIQKAIGWWLRVLGEHNPQKVIAFLDIHWESLKGVARKEATRKLSIKYP